MEPEPEDELPSVADAPPPAFEDEGSFIRRYVSELGAGFRPRETAGSFATDDRTGSAWLFFFLTFVPFTLLQGIIPFTHTLRFGDVFGIKLIGDPSPHDIWLDIGHAVGISLLIGTVQFVAFIASYRSLASAFGTPVEGAASDDLSSMAVRAVLYRAWWLPMLGNFSLPVALLGWAVPKDPPDIVVLPFLIFSVVPVILHFVGMRHAARRSCGVGPIASFAVILVPYVLMMVLQTLLIGDGVSDALISDWLPKMPVE